MKRYLLSLLAVFGLSAFAAESNDTLVKVNGQPSRLCVGDAQRQRCKTPSVWSIQ